MLRIVFLSIFISSTALMSFGQTHTKSAKFRFTEFEKDFTKGYFLQLIGTDANEYIVKISKVSNLSMADKRQIKREYFFARLNKKMNVVKKEKLVFSNNKATIDKSVLIDNKLYIFSSAIEKSMNNIFVQTVNPKTLKSNNDEKKLEVCKLLD